MTWEIALCVFILVATVTSLVFERIAADVTALIAFAFVVLVSVVTKSPHWPSFHELMGVFSSPAPVTIAAMFVVSSALEYCGILDYGSEFFSRWAHAGYRKILAGLFLLTVVVSPWMNNTTVVIMLLPVVLSICRVAKIAPSKLLIPLSYGAIFGGCMTAIGTSTNILISGVLEENKMEPLGMFELAPVGGVAMLVCIVYMILTANKLLPDRPVVTATLSESERQEYIAEALVQYDSEMVGGTLEESGLLKKNGVRLLEVNRDGIAVKNVNKDFVLHGGDRLVLACRPSGLMKARSVDGINIRTSTGLDLEQIALNEGLIIEGVLGPKTTLVGKTLSEINFRQRYRVIVLAVHRRGVNVLDQIDTLQLDFGDTLLMMGAEQAIEELRYNNDILVLDRPRLPAKDTTRKIPCVLAILLGLVVFTSLEWVPLPAAAIVAVAALFITRSIKPREAFDSIDWRLLILIFGMLGVGQAIEKSGFAYLFAETMVNGAKNFVHAQYMPYVMLAIIYLITLILTEILSNNATAVIMAPIAIGLAMAMGMDVRTFVMAVCFASSAGFALPIGYQTHMYVYSVGGYRFSDFIKIGLNIDLIYFVICMIFIPIVWPFVTH
jgi:di/tricarboxylate transporter